MELDGEILRLSNPIMLVMGADGVAMVPYCPFTDDEIIDIDYKYVMFMSAPNKQAENAYREQFGGIVTAPAIALDQLDS